MLACLWNVRIRRVSRCEACGTEGNPQENDEEAIRLGLGDAQTQHQPKTLISLLNGHFAPHLLEDWTCPNCGNSGGSQPHHIVAAPDLLVIVILRNGIDWQTGAQWKRKDIVTITPKIEISRFYFDAGARQGKLNYELVAVTKQMGTIHTGHYRVYGKQPNGRWKQADNASVTDSTFREVVKGDLPREQPFTPYQLVYKRVFNSTC